MGEILSKEEIEALLSAVSSGKVATEKKKEKTSEKIVISYDFKRPSIISKEQIRIVRVLHENFTRIFTIKLASYLRTMVEFEIVAIDQLSYIEFVSSLSNPTYIVILNMEPLQGQIAIEVDPSLTFSIIDRLLGGKGKSLPEARELTDIEHSIMEKVINLVLDCLKEAWQRIGIFNFKIKSKESNPQFVQIVPARETAILITMEAKIGEIGENIGIMNICIPYTTMEPILLRLNPKQWASEKKKETIDEVQKNIQKNLKKTKVAIITEIGRAKITILDFLKLSIGDVLQLEQNIKEDLVVKVEDLPKFYGHPGRIGRKIGIQITSKIEGRD